MMAWFKHWRQRLRRKGGFHGGLHVPSHKALSNQQPSIEPPLPPTLSISLRQIDGNMQIPQVSVGERVLRHQLISSPSNPYSVPRHAPTSGTVSAIEQRPDTHASNLDALHIVIDCDGLDQAQAPLAPLDYAQLDAKTLLARIQQCGIAGMGGAGFPTARKLSHQTNTLVVNAAECEPYITCDDLQMREHAEDILSGAKIAAHILGAERIMVGIEDDKPLAIEAMHQAQHKLADERISIHVVPTKYPSGNQRQLFELLLGIRVPNHEHATDHGLICHNSATMKAVHDAVILGIPLTERYVSVTGQGVQRPQVYRARIGTGVDYLVEQAGGESSASRWIIGGPMMGFSLQNHSVGIKKTSNCILLLPNAQIPQRPEQPCVRCSQCATACPMELLPQQLYWYSRNQHHDRLNQYRLFDCIECGICASVCPSSIPLVQYFRHSKGSMRQEKRKAAAADTARARHEAREARLLREAAERQARMAARRAKLNTQTTSKTSTQDDKQTAIEAAKARAAARKAARQQSTTHDDPLAAAKAKAKAAARREARLAQKASTTNDNNDHSERDDKLAAAKAKAAARREARLAQKATANDNNDHSERDDKLAAAKAKAVARREARLAQKASATNDNGDHSERDDKLAAAKAKAAARREARLAQKATANDNNDHSERDDKLAAAKAKAAARREARLAQKASATNDNDDHSERDDKLAVAKAKAAARREARLAQKANTTDNTAANAPTAPHIRPTSTDKDAIDNAKEQAQAAAKMAQAETRRLEDTQQTQEAQARLALAKERAEARRRARQQSRQPDEDKS